MSEIRLFTIGFTRKSAEEFFTLLKESAVKRIIDIRLNNVSQLAGFAKRDDLAFFLRAICSIEYIHRPDLAPTKDLLDRYKKKVVDWETYEREFRAIMQERQIEREIPRSMLDHACLLCSENTPEHCHRRLVAEFLRQANGNITVCHL